MNGDGQASAPILSPYLPADIIVECMSDGLVAIDRDWRYVYVNTHAAQLFGTTPDELIGKEYLQRFPEASGTLFQQAYQRAMDERVSLYIEEYYPPWNRWFENYIYPTPFGIAIFFHEITARKKVEEELWQQKEMISLILEALPVSIFIKDDQGRYLLFNEQASHVFNLAPGQVIGKTSKEAFPAEIAHALEEHARYVLSSTLQKTIEIAFNESGRPQTLLIGGKSIQIDGSPARFLGFAVDVTEQKQSEMRAQYLAHHDPLTGLPNRALLLDRLHHAITLTERADGLLAVMFMDLDRFKTINDSLGHSAGDKLLQIVAQRLQAAVREGDTVSRLGGDEFVILLENLNDHETAGTVAKKILAKLAQPIFIEDQNLKISASIGIAIYDKEKQTSDALLKNADIAMYHAKACGRNQFCYFELGLSKRVSERLSMENALRRGLETNQLILHFQPLIEIRTGRLTGVEVLVRWNHPEKGLILPDAFLPIAAESGLIVPLGEIVLRDSCNQFQQWRRRGLGNVMMSVNLDVQQVGSPAYASSVRQILDETAMPPGCLQLEITETGLMQDIVHAHKTLFELSEMGISLAIDDFGTGYSSLSYLKSLPINKLKIDQSFIKDVLLDSDDAAIVRAMIGLAHNMGLEVIAEGIETDDQYSFLAKQNCDFGQGYFISHPMDTVHMERFLVRQASLSG
jgi:diguanylate cyclase (GGDEF)-like protein/PAS domain S-box-containing protein